VVVVQLSQLIGELQRMLALHGDLLVLSQRRLFMEDDIYTVNIVTVGEDEDGNKDLFLAHSIGANNGLD
jgi:hypothetical protein